MKYSLGISSLLVTTALVSAAAAQTAPQSAQAPAQKAPPAAATPVAAKPATPAKPVALAPGKRVARFEALDTNKDGKLSKEEFQVGQTQLWQEADANKDGTVTLEEAKSAANTARTEHLTAHFNHLDDNHDGKVTPVEAGPMPAWRFYQVDANHDSVLSLEEMLKAPFPPMGHPRKNAEAETPAEKHIEMAFQKLDTNHDGKLTQEEIKARPSNFERLDTDNDGSLEPHEFFAHHGFLCEQCEGMHHGPGPGHHPGMEKGHHAGPGPERHGDKPQHAPVTPAPAPKQK